MASLFDLMGALNEVGPLLDKAGPFIEKLPGIVEQWGKIQLDSARLLAEIKERQETHINLSLQILHSLEPSLPPAIALEAISISASDPRNERPENAEPHAG